LPVWFGAWNAAEKWGTPPWVIMHEPETAWTKIKWIIRTNYIVGQFNLRAEREARLLKAKHRHGKHR
jgi:hypothetical protein